MGGCPSAVELQRLMWLKSTILHEAVVACVDLVGLWWRGYSHLTLALAFGLSQFHRPSVAHACFLTPLAVNRDRLRG